MSAYNNLGRSVTNVFVYSIFFFSGGGAGDQFDVNPQRFAKGVDA